MDAPTAARSASAVSSDAHFHRRERRISLEEYLAMGEVGILDEEDRVELLDGRLIDMPPIGPSHGHSVDALVELLARRLYAADTPLARVRARSPIQLDDYSAPEPDVVLYDPGVPTDRHPRPGDVSLVVEVGDTTVEFDREVKAQLYATAGVPEYWLVDLPNEAIDVFRQPEDDGYAERTRHRSGAVLSVSALPGMEPVPVEDILR
jgi:Uma2 family endonuclease